MDTQMNDKEGAAPPSPQEISRPDLTMLREQAAKVREQVARACAADIEAVLANHGCKLVGTPKYVSDSNGQWHLITHVEVVVLI